MPVQSFSHIGLSVRDADASMRFYCDALGFLPGARHELGADFSSDDPDKPLPTVAQFVDRPGLSLGLLQYPDPIAGPVPRPMPMLGIANFGLLVDDLEEVAAAVKALGGRVHTESLLDSANGRFLHCSDPDGVRIELMWLRPKD